MSGKGWTPDVLERLGVTRNGDRWLIPTSTGVLRYSDNGAKPKMLAEAGMTRDLWPRPEDVPGPLLIVVEGEPDAISAHCLGLPAVALPGTGKDNDLWPARLVAGRKRTVFICDCDATGRACMRSMAEDVTKVDGNAYVVDLDPNRDDKYDVGDLLADHGPVKARAMLDELIVGAKRFVPDVPAAKLAALARSFPEPGPWPRPLHGAAFYGLPGRFVRTVAPHSEADPAALLVQFLAVFGCAAGAAAGWKVDGAFHPARLWPLLVGDTSRGRKGTAAGRVREVIELAEPGWWREHVRAGLASGEGVVWHVRDPSRKRRKPRKGETVDKDGYVTEDEGVTDKRLLALETEFARVLAVMRRDGSTLSTTLRELWDYGASGSLTKHDPVTATGAHVIVVGHVTARELRERLTDTDQANGFGNRFLVTCVKRSKSLPFGGSLDEDGLSLLAGRVGEALKLAARVHGPLGMTDSARSLWRAAYDDLTTSADDLLAAITARAEPQVIRLAVAYALTDGVAVIDLEHLRAALAVWRYCEESAAHVFGGKTGNPLADRLLARIVAAGEDGTTRGELRAAVSHDMDTSRFDGALAHLERCLLARCEREPTAGRPRERWFAEPGGKPSGWDERSDAETYIPDAPLSSRSAHYGDQTELLEPSDRTGGHGEGFSTATPDPPARDDEEHERRDLA
jgi:hypothetical protein